ncbi:hypothetical protein ABTN33_20270, partial [Acinetobacter baumannii]
MRLIPPPEEELIALEELYYQTDGPHWHWKSNQTFTGGKWNLTNGVLSHDPCTELWQGIECNCLLEEASFSYRHPFAIHN